ncbi:PRC-barrel domain-containing protein [Parvibaculum sp.]|uniref:PRC-barrel domain-containing protein n=1 Tax=Parvibaculum sp. TaxID=2024848 RepID=UPI002B942708|nr:PRC-barrel domain-containing protein [Parvibaculum sp.]HUD51489.1 PRC-barrel domain-containing protein [Parvibaculum sp.]
MSAPTTTGRAQVAPNAAASQDVVTQSNGVAVISGSALSARYLRGASVLGGDNQKIGSIDDIVFDSSGNAQLALISVGGVAGIGGKSVGVNFGDLTFSGQDAKEKTAQLGSSADQLKSETAFDKEKLASGQVLASNYLGSSVKLAESDDNGKLSDVILDGKGHARYAAIDFGGLLGVGNKRVAVAYDKLGQPIKDQPIPLQLSKADLNAAPSFVYAADETTSSIMGSGATPDAKSGDQSMPARQ